MNFRIFICYSQSDFFVAGNKIRNYLSELFPDAYVYIDQIKSKGQKWKPENEKELRMSNLVIAIMTPSAIQSEEVEREIKIAQETEKRILPCNDKNTRLEWKDLPFKLGEIEGIKFEDEERLQRELFSEIKKIRIELSKSTLESKKGIQKLMVVEVEKSSYVEGELIVITGKVEEKIADIPVGMIVKDPNGKIMAIAQTVIDSNKKFRFELVAGGVLMKTEDIYKIVVHYGALNRSAETSFKFKKPKKETQEHIVKLVINSSTPGNNSYCIPEILKIKVGGKVKWINESSGLHTISSGSVDGFTASPSGLFDSGIMNQDELYKIIFKEKGTHDYFCMLHVWEKGKIIVD